ncbi:MAG: phosphatase PAP2 family protein [Chloroflexi bacterium]|nr:phosphatase PAP2 family protein [Chloroflexota bacterium]
MGQPLQNLLDIDERLSGHLRVSNGSRLRKTAVFFAHSGDSWFWMAGLGLVWLSSFIFFDKSWCYRCVFLAICIVIQALFVLSIKFLIRRRRPESDWGEIYRRRDPHSFPSGHATRAVMLAVITAGLGPTWLAWLLVVWAPLVCLARIMLGVHYLSDIAAGAVLGILLGWVLPKVVPDILAWVPFLF